MPERDSQIEARIEALRAQHDDDQAFVDALHSEADDLLNRQPGKALKLAERGLDLSREISYGTGVADGLLLIGAAYYILQENRKAFRFVLEAQPILERIGNPRRLAQCATILLGLHYTMGNYQKAMEYGHQAISHSRNQQTDQWEGWPNYLLGDVYRATGDLDRATKHYRRTYEIFSELGETEGKARGLIGLGTVSRIIGDYQASETYFSEALELMEQIDDAVGIARSLSDLALLRQATGDFDEALELFERSLKIRRERTAQLIVATCLIDLGRLLLAIDRPDDAIIRLNEALAIAREADHKPRMHAALEALAEAHRKMGDTDTALELYKEFHRVMVDVLSTDAATRIENLEISLEATAAQKEAELIKSYNDELRQKNDDLARLLQELKDAQEMLIQSEKMASLGQLTAGIAHEIRNPLNFVNNFSAMTKDLAEELAGEFIEHRENKVVEVEADFREITAEIIANAERILEHGRRAGQIVNSMLVHSRQSGGKKTDVDVNELVLTCVDLAVHGFSVEEEEVEPNVACDFDRNAGRFTVIEDELARVVTNILNNAFYATRERARSQGDGIEPRVRIQTSRHDGVVEILVADNGPGIPDEHKKRVFEPFFTTKPTGSGTGLGLSQSYEIVTKRHGGTLTVTDTPGGGATFVVAIPTG